MLLRHLASHRVPLLACAVVVTSATLTRPANARDDEVESCVRAAESFQELRDNFRLVQAREQLRTCTRDVCPGVVRDDCRNWLAELEPLVPSLIVVAHDSDGNALHRVRLRVDDREVARVLDGKPLNLDPGVHRVVFSADGLQTLTQEIVVRTGEKNRHLRVVLQREQGAGASDAPAAPILPWVLVGVGAAALGTGLYLGIDASSDLSKMRDSCAPGCPASEVDRAETRLLAADVLLGVGLVSVGAGTWLVLTGKEEAPASVALSGGPGGFAASWRRTF